MIVRMTDVQAEAVTVLIEDFVGRHYDENEWQWGFEGEVEGGRHEIHKQIVALGTELTTELQRKEKEKLDG